jgi:hypothetical protein
VVWGPNLQHTITFTFYYHLRPNLAKANVMIVEMTHSCDCPPHINYVKHLIYVWSRSGMSIKWMSRPYHYITVWYMSKIYTLTSKLGQGYCDDSGVRTHSYDCLPHTKYVKHPWWYVWSGSGTSMQGLGGPNHILQHVPSENPTLNPTPTPTTYDWPTPF